MVLKKIISLPIAMCLVLASLFALAFSGKAQATGTTLCTNATSNVNFSTIDWYENSSCTGAQVTYNSASEYMGDSIVLDNSGINAGGINVTDNISGTLSLANITFVGSGSGTDTLQAAGGNISLGGDLAFNTTGSEGIVNLLITLSTNSEITGSATAASFGSSASINLSSYNLTINSSIASLTLPALSGSGTLTLGSASSGTTYIEPSSDSSYSGQIVINSGSTLVVDSTADAYTLLNNLTLAGSGVLGQGAVQSCLGMSTTCESDGNNTVLTLSGNVALTGDTEVANGLYISGGSLPSSIATFDFTGDITYGGYTLTAVANSSTVVNLPAVPAGSKTTTLPSAPNTGTGLSASKSIYAVIGAVLIAGALFAIIIFTKKHKKLGI